MKKILFILFLLSSLSINCQELIVTSDKNPAIIGEQVLIQYSIDTKGDNFKSPNFKDLKVLSGPNPSTSSSYTFINGKSENKISTTYSFYIKATKEGVFNISPASVKVDGKTIKSNVYQLKVVKGNKRSIAQQKKISENLFISTEVNKRNIVLGEQILVTYKLLTRIELQNTELTSLPSLNGFWAKDLETSSRFKREIIDGIAYNVATIKKTVLTAQKLGKLLIDPMELKCSIRIQNSTRNNRDPFANFFGGGYKLKEEFITSKPITINVKALPKSPDNFTGAVGDFKIKSEIDKNQLNANDALTYKLTITGKGNIDLINPLTISFPEDFEVYDPKITNKIFEGGRKRSVKTFEYLLIPRYNGNYKIPSTKLIYYNINNKKYEITETNIHELEITPNQNTEKEGGKELIRIELEAEKKDINYIYTSTKLEKIDKNIISKKIFYWLFFLPILLTILLNFYNLFLNLEGTSNITLKNKKANKIALKRLKKAKKCIISNDYDAFFEEIEKSLWGYFSDKFKVSIADLSKQTVTTYFQSLKIDDSTKFKFINLLDECEFARYAPASNRNDQMDAVHRKAKDIIIEVETALK